jgi:hypothetical protein
MITKILSIGYVGIFYGLRSPRTGTGKTQGTITIGRNSEGAALAPVNVAFTGPDVIVNRIILGY